MNRGKLWKALDTIRRILYSITMARHFGEYQHSGWNGEFEFHRYRWRGEDWIIPSSSVTSHHQQGE